MVRSRMLIAEPSNLLEVRRRIDTALRNLVDRCKAELTDERLLKSLPGISPTPIIVVDAIDCCYAFCRIAIRAGALLTDREKKIALAVRSGLSDKAIASSLGLSRKTVTTHLERTFSKLGIHSRIELAIVADRFVPNDSLESLSLGPRA